VFVVGVFYVDLYLGNVLLIFDGWFVLIDFGMVGYIFVFMCDKLIKLIMVLFVNWLDDVSCVVCSFGVELFGFDELVFE